MRYFLKWCRYGATFSFTIQYEGRVINEESLRLVESSHFGGQFAKPLYDTYSFAQIPNTVRRLLTGRPGGLPARALGHLPDRYKKVILLFLDAFGWRFVSQRLRDYLLLKRFAEAGVISKLTTQFPSTTAAHVTTIHTNQAVGESGVYEWFYYEPTLDAMIAPLMFSYAGDKGRNTLKYSGVSAPTLYPTRTFYHQLAEDGIKSYVFQNYHYTPSPYSDVVFAGAKVVPYRTFSEALTNLSHAVLTERERSYFFLYFEFIDTIAHHYGPDSAQVGAEIDTALTALDRLLYKVLAGKVEETLLLITADHGQVEVYPDTTIYLNQMMPSITGLFKTDRRGNPLVPAGSARDMFLYVREDRLQEAYELLTYQLAGRAEVFRTADLAEQGFFGPVLSEKFRTRLANLVILPYAHESVWWYEKGRHEQMFLGHHGGLTRAELETVLLALPLGANP